MPESVRPDLLPHHSVCVPPIRCGFATVPKPLCHWRKRLHCQLSPCSCHQRTYPQPQHAQKKALLLFTLCHDTTVSKQPQARGSRRHTVHRSSNDHTELQASYSCRTCPTIQPAMATLSLAHCLRLDGPGSQLRATLADLLNASVQAACPATAASDADPISSVTTTLRPSSRSGIELSSDSSAVREVEDPMGSALRSQSRSNIT